MAKFWEMIKGVAVLAALGWAAWYAHSNWESTPTVASDTVQEATFNCRMALAELAGDYRCVNSDSCEATEEEIGDVRKLEADIARYCN
jgi:hypothetical protein